MTPHARPADTLIPFGAVWKYLDNGSDQGIGWIDPSFDDAAWAEGPGQLGYGDGDEATVLNSGPSGNFFITSYFRHRFSVPDPNAYAVLLLRVRRDDGVVVYLNGQEVYRNNMPEGPVTSATFAFNASDDGNTIFSTNVPTSFLVPGQNVLAAEIHQNQPGSSDISFDLEFLGNEENERPIVSVISPSEGAFYTAPATITMNVAAGDLDGSVTLVEFYQGASKLGEDGSSPFSFNWLNVPVGNYALRAVATDNLGAKGTSAVVNVSVGIATPPTVASKTPTPGNVSSLTSITVIFSENVSGVNASDLVVNGVPAASVTGSGTTYTFAFPQPADGTVFVGWNGAHGIVDFESPPKLLDPFGAGATWQYTLTDTTAPTVATVNPSAGSAVAGLDEIEVIFSEPVLGVNAADVRINNVPASNVSGQDAGPYTFQFAPPANGTVNITWTAGHGITDRATARNAFVGTPWTYTLNTNAVWDGQVLINEIMYHPGHDQAAFAPEPLAEEYVELHNRGATPVNLAGWRLNRAVEITLPNVNLPAGGYLVVAANLATFQAKHPAVVNVVGGWTGRLSNSRDEVELEDPSGNRVDLVEYADEGDWSVRTATGLGWEWMSAADGFGSSLELRQGALDNNAGQNWRPSTANNGTPGAANSVAVANLPPMIREVTHFPAVPRSTNSITVLARVVDESTSGLTVRLWRRDGATFDPFVSVAMLDNGASNDGAPGDGLYGVVLLPMSHGAMTEFYVEATDAASNARTWPAAADLGGGNFGQEANAFFQVDDEVYTGKQPFYRIIMRPTDRSDYFSQCNPSAPVQYNATFISVEGSDVQVRHNGEVRRRGAGSFCNNPPNAKFNIPRDRVWNDKSSLNLNGVNVHAQVAGSAVALKAGLPAPYARPVQVRFNGVNYANSGGGMFGSYAHVEVVDSEWARDHFPDDGNGNAYSKRRPLCETLGYLGATPQSYVNCAFDKESNASENDWTDLMNLMFAMDASTTPDNDYVAAVRRNLNVEQGLRYFAVLFMMNYTETALATGEDDDYDLYRGLVDPRFLFLPHDFDQVFGTQGSLPDDIFQATRAPNVGRFLRHPEFEPLYYAEFRRLLAGAFSTNQIFPILDQVLGDWVPAGTVNSMKNNALSKIIYVQGALPAAPVVVRATVSGEPDSPTYQNTATLNVGGTDITHYRYRVNGGAWSADTLVSQPINLTSLANGQYTVSVVGRNSAGTWQADADATVSRTWAVLSSLRGVVINEVLARNDGAVNHENTFPDIIELFNSSASSVDLSGLRLTDDLDDPNQFTFPAGTTLAAGAYRVIYANNPDGTSGLHTGFGLDQNGDQVYLLDRVANGDRVIDSVKFGWQLSNLSIGRQSNGQWGLCTPTSGGANTGTPTGPTATLKINEWLASPASPFVDDFIELYNPDALPVNLGGLYLTDQPIGRPLRDRITPLSFIDAFGYRAFIADGTDGPGHLEFSLSAEVGEIALFSGSGALIDCVVYGQQFAGVSQGRAPNGGSRIVYFDVPTPGAGNPAAPGPVQPTLVNLISVTDTFAWRYEDSGTDLGTSWSSTGFNDSTWNSGPALLGFDNNFNPPEPLRTSLAVVPGKMTYYFRAHFNLPAGLNLSGLLATHYVDDGAVFYINGAEAGRYNMPAAPSVIVNTTPSLVNVEANAGETSLNFSSLVPGDNVIAVEVHQSSAGSGDMLFGLRLDAVIITNNPAQAGIQINEVLANARSSTNSDGTITDWVELYNPSNGQVDLSGMSLTDQLTTPRRWVFPQGSVIAALGYRVVRFDSAAPATTNFAAVLNTGFGMKTAGDSLYLFNRPQSGGELLDSISFGIQAPDWSIGRVPSGGSNWNLNLPSPGGMNIATALGNPGLLKVNEWMADPGSGAA
ncbi:MAG TPA: lamin tail domain-containing protein, partial [Verrucomicrobiae bacterium]|nr:lamin tail domain-containing protein [Verrucomicrobiae bacterium]